MLQGHNVAQPIHNVVARLMPQLQNYNVAPRLSQSCIVSLNHDVLWMFTENVAAALKSRRQIHNVFTISIMRRHILKVGIETLQIM